MNKSSPETEHLESNLQNLLRNPQKGYVFLGSNDISVEVINVHTNERISTLITYGESEWNEEVKKHNRYHRFLEGNEDFARRVAWTLGYNFSVSQKLP